MLSGSDPFMDRIMPVNRLITSSQSRPPMPACLSFDPTTVLKGFDHSIVMPSDTIFALPSYLAP